VNIYIGNLAYSITGDDLRDSFGEFGEVSSANVITDKFSGQSKGFGFVEMPDDGDAEKAIEALNEQPLGGRSVRVNQAKPREERPRSSNPPERY
jgi:RNA recognition motif-containing protein